MEQLSVFIRRNLASQEGRTQQYKGFLSDLLVVDEIQLESNLKIWAKFCDIFLIKHGAQKWRMKRCPLFRTIQDQV